MWLNQILLSLGYKFVLFCFGATFCSIAISIGLSFLLNPRDIQGEFVQASYRSSAAILGIAIIQNLYGDAGMAPLMIIASVPLYNVMAVMVLSFMKPDNQGMNKQMLLKTLKRNCQQPYYSWNPGRSYLVCPSSASSNNPFQYCQ